MGSMSSTPQNAEHGAPVLTADWPAAWGDRQRRGPRPMIGIGIALLLLGAALSATSGGLAGPLWSGVVLGLFGLTALAVGLRAPFGSGRMRMINAVTLTRARVAPPDSWVHFARERRTGAALLVVLAVWGVVMSAAAVVAFRIGLAGRPQAFLGMAVVGVLAVLFLYGAIRGAVAQYRLDSFGRRPVGVSLGPSGIAVLRIGDPVYIPWDAIRSIDAGATEPRRGQETLPLIRLRVDPHRVQVPQGDRVGPTITLMPATLRLHPHVLWTALRVFGGSPVERAKLGTTFGQQLLDGWCAEAARG